MDSDLYPYMDSDLYIDPDSDPDRVWMSAFAWIATWIATWK